MHEVEQQEAVKGLGVATCGPGTKAFAVIDGKVVVLVAPLGPTGPTQRLVLPAPPGGRVIALGAGQEGPVAVTAGGTCSCWNEREKKWQRFGNLKDER